MGARVSLNGLQPGTLYYLQFQAKNEALGMYSQWSNIFELQTIFDIVPPMPVDNLVWEPIGTSFRATWDAPQYSEDGTLALDLAGYEVKIYAPADGAVPGIPVPEGPARTLTYKTISPNFDFTFEMNKGGFDWPRGKVAIEVRAYDNTGNMSQPTFAVAQNPVPAQVQNFDAVGGVDQISFTWTKNPDPPDGDIAFYRIRQGLAANSVTTIVSEINDIKSDWTTIYTGMQYFSITAVDVFYQESAVRSTDSAQARSSLSVDSTNPGAPTSVATTSGVDTSDPGGSRVYIDVTWVKPSDSDLQQYVIRYSPNGTQWQYLIVPAEDSNGTAVQTARIFGLVAGTSYYVAIQSEDFTGNHSVWVNSSNYPQTTQKDTTAPSTPAAPTLAANTMQIQVTHNLKKADGTTNLEQDLTTLEVYASTTSGFTPSSTNKLGDMEVVPPPSTGTPVSAIQNFYLPANSGTANQTWYAKVIAVDNAGNKSAASAQSSASVPLVNTLNIADAAITDAKIGSLSANKIIAGTGFINDITVKSQFTLGDASTNGVIQSYDYVGGGTTGFRLEKNSLIIQNGNISARALRLQDGQNLVHPAYGDFEWAPVWYNDKVSTGNGATVAIDSTKSKYHSAIVGQSLKLVSVAQDNGCVFLGPGGADNIILEPSTTYIISAFVYHESASSRVFYLTVNDNNGVWFDTGTTTAAPNTWVRVHGTITTGANTTAGCLVLVNNSQNTTAWWDGVQVEQQTTGQTTPSQWTPPSVTKIDGGDIRTGEIRSTAPSDGVVGEPAWSINTQGNFKLGSGVVRGRLFVGPDNGVPDINSIVQSSVYTAFASGTGNGWIIRGDGYAEFNNVLVRGNIQATSGRFLNTIKVGANDTDSASSVQTEGFIGMDGNGAGGKGWIIRGDGYAQFNNVAVRGNIYADNGYFRGNITGASGTFSGNLSAATIDGGTITGANIRTRGSVPLVQLNSTTYNKIHFWAGQHSTGYGEINPADIRVAESAADRYIQIYSADYGGGRAHISVGAGIPNVDYPQISISPDNGFTYVGGQEFNVNTTRIVMSPAAQGMSFHNLQPGSSRGLYLNSAGGGNIVQVSSSARRWKKDIVDFDVSVDDLRKLRPVWFRWNTELENILDPGEPRHGGFIADEVADISEDMAFYEEDGLVGDYDTRAVLAGAVKLIQDLYGRIEELESRL